MWKFLGMAVAIAAIAVAAVLAMLWFAHTRPVTLPAPSGLYPVGRADYDWVDRSRIDPVAPVPGTPRELTVWIWYPALPGPQSATVDYEPAPLRGALMRHVGPIMRNLLTHDLSRVRCHALRGAQVSPARRQYPIVLFKPGIGALALDYTTLAEDLASHGYIVVASDSPHSTAVVVYRDGRIVTRTPAGHPTDVPMAEAHRLRAVAALAKVWAADERFLLDQLQRMNGAPGLFSGRLDLQSVGAFGHSFGGATAYEFCSEDVRCKAGIDVDGRLFDDAGRLTKPFLFLLSDHSSEPKSEAAAILRQIEAAAAHVPNRPAVVTVPGSRHFNFSDMALTKNSRVARMFGMLGPAGERPCLAMAADRIHSFFDAYLIDGKSSAASRRTDR